MNYDFHKDKDYSFSQPTNHTWGHNKFRVYNKFGSREICWIESCEAKAKYRRASNAFRNAFTLPELGWVNCDRFLEYPMEQLAQIKTSKMLFYPASSKLILVLSDRNIATDIIQWEHKPTFQKVPKDENAFVAAMKIENGQPYMSFHSVRTANMEVDLDFKLVTAAEIKEKLKLLDNG